MRTSAEITPVVPTLKVVGAAPVGAKVTVPPSNAVLASAAYVEAPDRIPQCARSDLPGRPIGAAGTKSIRRADQRIDGGALGAVIDITAID